MGGEFEDGSVTEEISSQSFTHELPFNSEGGILAMTEDNEFILGVNDSLCNTSVYQKLFYDTQINLTRKLIIDNSVLLDLFDLRDPVVFDVGYYEVHRRDGLTYIAVQI